MSCMVLLEVKANAGTGADMVGTFKSILPDTRAYDGCLGVEVYQNQDDPDVVVLVEKWESKAHYEKYFGWRQETGLVDQLVQAIQGPPSLRYFDPTDA